MPRRYTMPFKPRLSRHLMEYEGRWAWEQASESDRQAYNAYLERGTRGRFASGNEEIPLSFPAFMARRQERRDQRRQRRAEQKASQRAAS